MCKIIFFKLQNIFLYSIGRLVRQFACTFFLATQGEKKTPETSWVTDIMGPRTRSNPLYPDSDSLVLNGLITLGIWNLGIGV